MHAIHLKTSLLDLSVYESIRDYQGKGKGKSYSVSIGQRKVTFQVYQNGTIMVSIASSRNPFRMMTEEDVAAFFSFLGRVRQELAAWIPDPHDRIIPDVVDWLMKSPDLNKDTRISALEQLTLPDIQVSTAGKVFRAYVKDMGEKAVYRIEANNFKEEYSAAVLLDRIIHPQQSLEEKIVETIKQELRIFKAQVLQRVSPNTTDNMIGSNSWRFN